MSLDINHYNALFLDNPGQNDATTYDVKLHRFIDTSQPYYRCIGIHHLSPDENAGNHHVFLDVLDEQGQRMRQAQIEWTWDGRKLTQPAPPVTINKADTEPGTNIAINWAQNISVSILHQHSDLVLNLHTRHPDESSPDAENGNTRGHHSFYVVFQRQPGDDTPPVPPPNPPPTDMAEKYSHLLNTVYGTTALMNQMLDAMLHNTAQLQDTIQELIGEAEYLQAQNEDDQ